MKSLRLLPLLACLWLLSCNGIENEFSSAPCYVLVDNATHQDATLASAMNPMAPGIFCLVQRGMRSGVETFDFKNNQNAASSKPFNGIDKRRTYIFGLNNGVIVGYSNLENPSTLYGFDAECPNCFDPSAIPMKSYVLSMSTDGLATCPKCKRSYNLNAGGSIAKGDAGKKLTRYHAHTAGAFGMLAVTR